MKNSHIKRVYVNHEFKKAVLIRTIIKHQGMKQKNKISQNLHDLFLALADCFLADNTYYVMFKVKKSFT